MHFRPTRVNMPIKGSGEAEMRVIDRWDGGAGWIAYPDEGMQRASHTLAADGEVWVVDPVDAPGVDDLLAEYGDVAGVVVGLDRHTRDAATVARRHDAPVYVSDWMTGVADDVDAPVERFGRTLPGTDYRAITVHDRTVPPWQEVALYRERDGTLLVPESVGTAPFFLAADERLGVHPALRFFPPKRALSGLRPDRVLVGHGEGVFDRADRALSDALSGSRRRSPKLYAETLRRIVTG